MKCYKCEKDILVYQCECGYLTSLETLIEKAKAEEREKYERIIKRLLKVVFDSVPQEKLKEFTIKVSEAYVADKTEELLSSVTKKEQKEICKECNGKGLYDMGAHYEEDARFIDCPNCKGHGYIEEQKEGGK